MTPYRKSASPPESDERRIARQELETLVAHQRLATGDELPVAKSTETETSRVRASVTIFDGWRR